MIKAVVFDIDGVLMDSFEANYEFFGNLLSNFGYEMPNKDAFSSMFHMTMINTIKHITGSTDEEEILKIWEFGKNLDVPHHLLKIPEHSKKIIENLSTEYTLAIVTSKRNVNIFKAPQMQEIEKYFKTAIGFNDVQNHKPHPEPLLLAADRLGVLPEEVVYIGDMPSDREAARSAGMKFILFNTQTLPDVDATTYSFLELPNIIKNL
jgi:HAD superfamily hydrolase (TIGR01509 family)